MAAGAEKMRGAFDDDRNETAGGLPPLGSVDLTSGRLVLCSKRTLPTAEAFVQTFHSHPDGPKLRAYRDTLMEWSGNRYVEREDAAVRHLLHPWLHSALRRDDNRRRLVDFEANPQTVNQALDSIKNLVHLPDDTTAPSWLDGRTDPPADEILACRTLNLHVPTGRTLAPTPALFTTAALDYDYDPHAPPPVRWIAFLNEIFSDDTGAVDREAVDLFGEWAGYCLTSDTSLQKALLMVGPRRSGKGTAGRVLTQVIGPGSVVNPTTHALAGTFGLQPLLGKTLAIISDARFSGDSIPILVERLLNIIGEDAIGIERKFKSTLNVRLPTRFMFLANELPRFRDSSAALTGRFLILRLTKSFYDKEDPTLTDVLLTERAGILNWALDGLRRLRERGHFIQPTSAVEAVRDLEDLASPVGAFIREQCIVAPGRRVEVERLFRAWRTWAAADGRASGGPKQRFGVDLSAAAPGVKRRKGTGDISFYEGIGLKEEQ